MNSVTFKFIPDNTVSYNGHEKYGFGVIKECSVTYDEYQYNIRYSVYFPDINQTKIVVEKDLILIKE